MAQQGSAAEFLKSRIREVPDFPKPGILFYDITTLLRDPQGFREFAARARPIAPQAEEQSSLLKEGLRIFQSYGFCQPDVVSPFRMDIER